MFKSLVKDNANDVKSFSKDNVPPEALFIIKGLEIPNYSITPFAKSTDSIPIDTRDMSLLEVACCTQRMKVVQMMTETLNMRNSRDFIDDRRNKSIQEQRFIFIPILNRDAETLQTLMELSNIWSMQDIQDIMSFCKQVKWPRGVEIVLESKSCTR